MEKGGREKTGHRPFLYVGEVYQRDTRHCMLVYLFLTVILWPF